MAVWFMLYYSTERDKLQRRQGGITVDQSINRIDPRNYGKGLASVGERLRGDRLYYRIKDLAMEVRYAWQRAWWGYDDRAVYDLGPHLVDQMPILLKEFKRKGSIRLRQPGALHCYSELESEQILNELIFYFQNCSESHVYQRLHGISRSEAAYDRAKVIAMKTECSRCRAEALRLFQTWCFALWR